MQDCYGCLLSPVTAQGISAYTVKHDSKTSLSTTSVPHGCTKVWDETWVCRYALSVVML